jgi:hypothetical protein
VGGTAMAAPGTFHCGEPCGQLGGFGTGCSIPAAYHLTRIGLMDRCHRSGRFRLAADRSFRSLAAILGARWFQPQLAIVDADGGAITCLKSAATNGRASSEQGHLQRRVQAPATGGIHVRQRCDPPLVACGSQGSMTTTKARPKFA